MDGVEIVMDVEDHFGISIQDSEAECIRTVGDLVVLIQLRVSAAQRESCPSLSAFLSLRKATREILGDDSVRFRSGDAVASILGPSHRRALWKRLAEMMGTSLCPLCRPKWLRRSLLAISMAVLLLAIVSAIKLDVALLPLTICSAVGVVALLHYSTKPCCSFPPDGWTTFGQITTKIVGVTAATKRVHLRTHDEILDELRPLLVDVLGVAGTEVVPSARFVEDLGMS